MNDLPVGGVLTVETLCRALEVLADNKPGVQPDETIGEPSRQMSNFEKVMRRSWAAFGGVGNPPKIVVNESFHGDLLEAGCPEKLMVVARRL
jgi:hypothetical protein